MQQAQAGSLCCFYTRKFMVLGVTQLNFNLLIFMEANVALHKTGSLKIRYLKNQLRNS